ncbi:4Fe-4S ferredoxin [Marinilabiliaceae bacterium JC040]|nr:4Fe-4S ferredoxin [Marinilabiliaceae bacterium JC040]
MRDIIVNNDLCAKDHVCPLVKLCPADAISQKSIYDAPTVDLDKCVRCGKCVKLCPYKAFNFSKS